MEYYFIIIPILFTILFIAICYNRSGWEMFKVSKEEGVQITLILTLPTIGTLILIAIMSAIMKNAGNSDTEYLSYYYTKLRHTDKWDEYIHRTCTRRVKVGEDSEGNSIYEEEEYDCSYVDYHPERWIAYDNDDNEIYMEEEQWNKIKNKWQVPSIFVDMHRDYYRTDGDAQDYVWNNKKETIETYSKEHPYQNYIKHSQTQFKFRDISDDEAKGLRLYKYPTINNDEQNPIIGYKRFIKKSDVKELQWFNAVYGKKKQIRTFLLIYPNASPSIVDDQKCYWQGGNKNEFICCIGINSKTNKLQWVNCFSWLDDATMELKCQSEMMKDTVFSVQKYSAWLQKDIKLWKRKQFSDFDYIKEDVELSEGQMLAILITVLTLNLIGFGAIIYGVMTEEK